jgi:hypothetical protein
MIPTFGSPVQPPTLGQLAGNIHKNYAIIVIGSNDAMHVGACWSKFEAGCSWSRALSLFAQRDDVRSVLQNLCDQSFGGLFLSVGR